MNEIVVHILYIFPNTATILEMATEKIIELSVLRKSQNVSQGAQYAPAGRVFETPPIGSFHIRSLKRETVDELTISIVNEFHCLTILLQKRIF